MIGFDGIRRPVRTLVLGLVGALLLGTGAASAQVVISQAYGGGGNSGATYTHDFIELFNRGATPVDLSGWSVQYAKFDGSSWQVTNLGNHILQPGQYYLVQEAQGAGGSTPLPTPDAFGTTNMSGTTFKLALVNSTTPLSGTCPSNAGIQDFLGAASTANCYEGSAPAPAPSNTTAVLRANAGCADTDDNAADFSTGAPTPRNTSSATNVCAAPAAAPIVAFAPGEVSEPEGNTTANTLVFTVNYAPAIASGDTLAFDISVSGDAGRYSYTGPAQVVLGENDAGPYLIQVQTVPNTVTDGDATVTVTLSNFAGADLSQADPISQNGTIVDDDIAYLAINEIQGSGQFSPYENQVVTTCGIITGITTANRLYIQSHPDDEDGDPATSEGLYVYTPPSGLSNPALGDLICVTGTILEYIPGGAGALPITEMGNAVSGFRVSSGHALPTPVVLDATAFDPDGTIDQLERYEYMRVTVPRFVVTAPTGAGSNDEFFGVAEGLDRPMREAGVDAFRCGVDPAVPGSRPLPAEAPGNVPCWDNNPELLRVKTSLLSGGSAKTLRSGTTLEDLTGVLDYAMNRYTILTRDADFATIDTSTAENGTPVSQPSATEVTIGGFNVENLAQAGGVTYTRKADKIARTIVDYLHTPDVLGLIEVGNPETLQDIADRIGSYAANDPEYEAVMVSTSGSQRLGFLLKRALVGAQPRVTLVGQAQEYGAGMHVLCPDGVSYTAGLLNDRPPLVLDLVVRGPNDVELPITVINNHLKSMIDVDSEDDATASYECFNRDGDGIYMPGGKGRGYRAKRQQNAEFTAGLVQSLQEEHPERAIVMVGDFNAFEFNDGYADMMGTIKGEPSADDETVVPGDGLDLVDPDLVLLTELVARAQRYSYTFQGNAQTIDQILASQAMIDLTTGIPRMEFARVNADFHQADRTDTSNAFGNSDHDPALAFFGIAAFRTADLVLATTPAAASAQVGDVLSYAFTVSNDGPDEAAAPRIALDLPAGLGFESVNAPGGWSCDAPAPGASGTLVCMAELLPDQAIAAFTVTAKVGVAAAGSTVSVSVAASTTSTDPVAANDAGSFSTVIGSYTVAIFVDGFEAD